MDVQGGSVSGLMWPVREFEGGVGPERILEVAV